MKKYINEIVNSMVLDDVICDICGNSCGTSADFEHLHIVANWGYGSHKDGEKWDIDLCENCADKFDAWVQSLGGKINKTCLY